MEKSQIEKEYTDLSTEFDGYTSTIKNDSLLKLFENEKLKVKSLLDELRTTKATDAIRIAQLKRELATVRKVMIMPWITMFLYATTAKMRRYLPSTKQALIPSVRNVAPKLISSTGNTRW